MKTVSNIEELTIEIISQFADMFEKEFAPYSYTMMDECIHILNHEKVTVLSIRPDSVTVKDIIQDTIDKFVYEEALKIRKKEVQPLLDMLSTTSVDGMTLQFFSNQFNYIKEPEDNYKTFKYFNTEEQWFQQSTVHQDVLPYETALNINRIKKVVLNDLTQKWTA
jgi:hypothetical protein